MPDLPTMTLTQGQYDRIVAAFPSGAAALWSGNVSTTTAWSFAYMTPPGWPSTLPGVAV